MIIGAIPKNCRERTNHLGECKVQVDIRVEIFTHTRRLDERVWIHLTNRGRSMRRIAPKFPHIEFGTQKSQVLIISRI